VGAHTSPVDAQRQLTDALRRWRDLSVSSVPANAEARDLARRSHAGRLVVARLAAVGDSLELSARLVDQKGDTLRQYAARAPSGDAGRVAGLYLEASAVLTSDAAIGSVNEWSAALATDRASAWRAYSRARDALGRWDLASAIKELRVAVARDPEYAPAQLWLAQTSAWMLPSRPADWKSPAQRAVALSARLPRRDSLLAAGVSHLAVAEFPQACEAYTRARDLDPASDVAWYGLGQCRSMDPVVVRDARSPSGWRFRGAYHTAAMAYDSAIARA
jgi:tetratricopeptide (TPR) repeat protein